MESVFEPRMHVLGRLITSRSRAASIIRILLAISGIIIGLRNFDQLLVPPAAYPKDFIQEYVMAGAAAHGLNPYLPPNELAQRFAVHLAGATFPHPSPHPPPVAVLFLPLSVLDYSTAAYVWLAIGLASVVVSVYILMTESGARFPLWSVLLAAVAMLSWPPFAKTCSLAT